MSLFFLLRAALGNTVLTSGVLVSVVMTALVGCATQSVLINAEFERQAPELEQTTHFFFWGFSEPERKFEPNKVCKNNNNVARVERRFEPMDIFYTGLTLGIYMPQTVKIYCRKGSLN